MIGFASISSGRERWQPLEQVPRHRHERPYAAILLAGSYEECGSIGRFRVGPGDVLLHNAFDDHLDHFGARGAEILNLPLQAVGPSPIGHVDDPDGLVRMALTNVTLAQQRLLETLRPCACVERDWPDLLASDLRRDPRLRLDAWARNHGLTRETLSRGFGKTFGVSPAAYRAEVRARRAFRHVSNSCTPLAAIAMATGFADQAHMTRAIVMLTGAPPGRWRGTSNRFKTHGN